MSDAAAAAAAPAESTAPVDTAAPAGDAPKEGGADYLEILLGEGPEAKPTKIPMSKIPVEKLNPHLAKLRSEADRRMSEADKRAKELDARAQRYDTVEKLAAAVKSNPDMLYDLAKELGLDEEQLQEMSQRQIESRIRRQMREEAEEKDPKLKAAREEKEELEALRKEREALQKEKEEGQRVAFRQQSERFIIDALETGFKGLSKSLQADAAIEMTRILREEVAKAKDDLSDFTLTREDLAKRARASLRARAARLYEEDAEAEPPSKLLERLGKKPAPAAAHPAVSGSQGSTGKNGTTSRAQGKNFTDMALNLLRL